MRERNQSQRRKRAGMRESSIEWKVLEKGRMLKNLVVRKPSKKDERERRDQTEDAIVLKIS